MMIFFCDLSYIVTCCWCWYLLCLYKQTAGTNNNYVILCRTSLTCVGIIPRSYHGTVELTPVLSVLLFFVLYLGFCVIVIRDYIRRNSTAEIVVDVSYNSYRCLSIKYYHHPFCSLVQVCTFDYPSPT